MNHEQTPGKYKIGAVSRMTGITPETLRMWERRYELVHPDRSDSQARLYSDEDVRYLALLNRLVCAGHAIGSLVELNTEELEQRLQTHTEALHSAPVDQQPATPSICVLGSALPALLREAQPQAKNLHLVGLFSSAAEFEQQVTDLRPDVLVLEYRSLMADDIKQMRDRFRLSGAKRLILVYQFANAATLRKCNDPLIQVVRGPLNTSTLELLCQSAVNGAASGTGLSIDAPVPERRYGDAQLSKIATVQTSVGCECPHHVADILLKLTAFETYSQDCEDRNEDDAALHAHLRHITMQARATFEAALPRILEADGIDLNEL